MATLNSSFKKTALVTAMLTFTATASADILTSIKPLGFIASSIAEGVTKTDVLVPAGASPHDYSLKPSDIQKIKSAELILWIGEDVDMFLDTAALRDVELKKVITAVEISEITDDMLHKSDHSHDHHSHAHHAHEGHSHASHSQEKHEHCEAHQHHEHKDEHKHEYKHDHDHDHKDEHKDEHKHEHKEAHAHDHKHEKSTCEHHADEHEHRHEHKHEHKHEHQHSAAATNWHIWYSPKISSLIAKKVAERLTQQYPDKKALIEQNLAEFNRTLAEKDQAIKAQLQPVQDKGFYVFHDAYTYFNETYDLEQKGYFTINPLVAPGAKTLAHIKHEIQENKVTCLFAEPQFTPKVIEGLKKSTGVKVGQLDPMGDKVALGKNSYANFLQYTADSYLSCLK